MPCYRTLKGRSNKLASFQIRAFHRHHGSVSRGSWLVWQTRSNESSRFARLWSLHSTWPGPQVPTPGLWQDLPAPRAPALDPMLQFRTEPLRRLSPSPLEARHHRFEANDSCDHLAQAMFQIGGCSSSPRRLFDLVSAASRLLPGGAQRKPTNSCRGAPSGAEAEL